MNEYSDLEVRHPSSDKYPVNVPSTQPGQPSQPSAKAELADTNYPNKEYPSSHGGMGKRTLAGLAALVTAVVVGAAVGGGVGASLKSCQNQKRHLSANSAFAANISTTTVTITADSASSDIAASSTGVATAVTHYLVPAPSSVSSVAFNCQDGLVQESTSFSGTFHVYCGTDFGGAQASTSKDSDGNTLNYLDVLGVIAYSTSHCMQACLELNHWGDSLGRPLSEYCQAIHFSAEMARALSENAANCWLKNGTPADAGSFPVGDTSTGLSATLEQN